MLWESQTKLLFSKHDIPVYFKPINTLRQWLVHAEDKNTTTQVEQCCVCDPLQGWVFWPVYWEGQTAAPQARGSTQKGQLIKKRFSCAFTLQGHSFEDDNTYIIVGEDRLFERGVKEAIYRKIKSQGWWSRTPIIIHLQCSHDSLFQTF